MTLGKKLNHAVSICRIGLIAALSCATIPTTAHAVNSVVVESKRFAPGQTRCSVGVFVSNDVPISGMVIPLELRTTLGSAYPTVPTPSSFRFRLVPGNRIDRSPLGSAGENWPVAMMVTSYLSEPYAGSSNWMYCSGPLSRTYTERTQSIDGASPDAVFFAAISSGDPRAGEEIFLQPGMDPREPDGASFVLVFDLSEEVGCFRIDTCCVGPSNHLTMVNEYSEALEMKFTRGIIGVGETMCPGSGNPELNTPPTVLCHDSIEIPIGAECEATLLPADIDAGSYDAEDGSNLIMSIRSLERLTPGKRRVVLTACDQDVLCASCTTMVYVRGTIPHTVSAEPDSIFFYFSDSTSQSEMCREIDVSTTGCFTWVGREVSGLIDVMGAGSDASWSTCVNRALASNAPEGVYNGHIIFRNGEHRDTVSVTVEVNHPAGVIRKPGCDTIRGFTLRPTGEPVAGVDVQASSCLSGDEEGCGLIPGGSATSGSDGSFVIQTHGFSSVTLEAWESYRYARASVLDCENVPTYLYMRDGYGVIPHSGVGQPDTIPCLASGFIRRYNPDNSIAPIEAGIVELWDSYPSGTRVSVDTSDGYGHFGPWIRGGMLVAKAIGYCPTVIGDFRCDDQPTFVSVEPLGLEIVETPHYDDYTSLGALFAAYPVQPGDVVTATDPQGTICGILWIEGDGSDHIRIFGDDPKTPIDEGAVEGDSITFLLNCRFPAVASRQWHNIGAPFEGAGAEPPKEYMLAQNYPNPFNAGTVISFDINESTDWTLTIYNIMGQRVREFTGQTSAARVNVQWDGRSESGLQLASGVYFYRLSAGEFVDFKKMLLVK